MLQFLRSNKYASAMMAVFLIVSGASGAVLVLDTSRVETPRMLETPLPKTQEKQPTTSSALPITPAEDSRRITNQKKIGEDVAISISRPIVPPPTAAPSTTNQNTNQIRATLFINDTAYQIIASPNTSLYSAIEKLRQDNQITFRAKEFSGMGYFIEEINGIENNARDGTYWIYYVNGESAKVGVSTYILKPNDIITWKYETTNL